MVKKGRERQIYISFDCYNIRKDLGSWMTIFIYVILNSLIFFMTTWETVMCSSLYQKMWNNKLLFFTSITILSSLDSIFISFFKHVAWLPLPPNTKHEHIDTCMHGQHCIFQHIPIHRFNLLIADCQGWVFNNVYGHQYSGYTSSRHVGAHVCFFQLTPMATCMMNVYAKTAAL